VQPLDGDPVERGVVEHDDRVRVERQPLERQQRVVGVHDHVRAVRLVLIRKHAALAHTRTSLLSLFLIQLQLWNKGP
jgi:hypothetical protein